MTHGIVEIPSELSGGRNLLLGSSVSKSSTAYLVSRYTLTEDWIVGQRYTITIKGTVNAGQRFGIWRDNGTASLGKCTYDAVTDTWKLTATAYETSRVEQNILSVYNVESTRATSANIDWIKLEKGEVSTSHQEAPEDLGYDLPMWVQNFDAPITQTPKGIAGKNIVEIPSGLVGGRNLFKGHALNQEITLNPYQGVGSFTQFHNQLTIDPKEHLGADFTISLSAKSPNGVTSLLIYNNNGNPRYFNFHITLDSALGTEWKDYTITFKNVDRGDTYPNAYNRIEIYAPNKMGVMVKNIKVEKGSKSTPYQEAPENLGYQLPIWVHNFDAPISINPQGIAVKELVEIPEELTTGRNLIKGTSSSNKVVNQKVTDHFFQQGSDYKLEVGKTYTFSIIVDKISTDTHPVSLDFGVGTIPGSFTFDTGRYNKYNIPFGVRISSTFTVRESDLINQSGVKVEYFSFRLRNALKEMTLGFREVKLEMNDVVTPWEPAPEDLGYSLPSFAKNFGSPISITPQGIAVSGRN